MLVTEVTSLRMNSGPTTYIIPSHIESRIDIEFRKLMKPYNFTDEYCDGLSPNNNSPKDSLMQIDDHLNELTLSDNSNETKAAKRVKFADSVGLDLVHIRHMTAGRDTPPDLSGYPFRDLNLVTDKKPERPILTLGFQQPVADYNQFRESLDCHNISLESVSINDASIVGTIKVKNLAFHKTVFARFTTDNWMSSQDITAFYVNNGLDNGQGSQMASTIDTFSFTFDLPAQIADFRSIQFAVCFKCNGQEFWDNNQGKNYIIHVKSCSPVPEPNNPQRRTSFDCYADRRQTNWTEFAIWRNLGSDYAPYW